MDQTKVYTAPSADVVLMMPGEPIAAKDYGFDYSWRGNGWFTFQSGTETGSGVAINRTFPEDNGYTIIRNSNTQ